MTDGRENHRPLVSVVIPNLNRRQELLTTLEHLSREPYPSLEIIVVDNGSSDNSVGYVRTQYPNVKVIPLKKNIGAEARNTGFFASKGEYILMLDSDSHPEPGAIGRMAEHFESDPKLGAAAFRTVLTGEGGRDEAGGIFNVFIGCGCGFRRDALLAAGAYPSGYRYYVEEYDVSYRLMEAGDDVRYFEDLVVLHRKSPDGRRFGNALRFLVRNNLFLYARYFPFGDAVRTLRWQMFRYFQIARHYELVPSFCIGLAGGLLRAVRGLAALRRLSEGTLDRTVPDRVCTRRVAEVAREHNLTSVVIWGVGRDFSPIVNAARKAGLSIQGAYPTTGQPYFKDFLDVCGVPILGSTEFEKLDVDAVLIASLSPGETKNEIEYLKTKNLSVPVIPLFPYGVDFR